jgi:hypothetical protein
MSKNTLEANPEIAPPQPNAIIKATILAAFVAGVLLITTVLPAEYGIDPLKTGKALGLTELSKSETTKAAAKPTAAAPPAPALGTEVNASITPVLEPAADGGAPRMKGTFIPQTKGYQMDSRELKLEAGEGLEIKYNMKKGAGIVYSWTASDKLLFEFHGEPNAKPPGKEGTDYYETYDIDNQAGKDQGHGTFIAPSSGIHGWFWENKTGKAVTLKVISAGFYDWIFLNRNNKETAVKPIDPESIPGHPKIPDEALH